MGELSWLRTEERRLASSPNYLFWLSSQLLCISALTQPLILDFDGSQYILNAGTTATPLEVLRELSMIMVP